MKSSERAQSAESVLRTQDPLPRESEPTDWMSAHLWFPGDLYDAMCDGILCHIVLPFCQQASGAGEITRYFFVRYGERGPHVRIRVLPSHVTHRTAIARRLVACIEAHLARLSSERSHPWTLEWVSYMPEYERYGGPRAMSEIERCFDASSRFAFSQFALDYSTNRDIRLGRAALAFVVSADAFLDRGKSGIGEFARSFSRGFLARMDSESRFARSLAHEFAEITRRQRSAIAPFVNSAIDTLRAGEPLPAQLNLLHQAHRSCRAALAQLALTHHLVTHGTASSDMQTIAPLLLTSLIHMTNNRLGVRPLEEALIGHLLASVLDERR